jgi:hypothetical protein
MQDKRRIEPGALRTHAACSVCGFLGHVVQIGLLMLNPDSPDLFGLISELNIKVSWLLAFGNCGEEAWTRPDCQ